IELLCISGRAEPRGTQSRELASEYRVSFTSIPKNRIDSARRCRRRPLRLTCLPSPLVRVDDTTNTTSQCKTPAPAEASGVSGSGVVLGDEPACEHSKRCLEPSWSAQ